MADEEAAIAAGAGAGDETMEVDEQASSSPVAKKKVVRKQKRRTMDAHFWGMSDAEIASIKASLAADAAAAGESEKDATPGAGAGEHEHEQEEEQKEEIPEGQLPKEEIERRRRILHTDWRMAAFSQFAHCFPHLCIKEFSIDKLERDLDGTDPGSYVGEVISRLLYHLTKDSSLAGKSPDKPWLIRLRREFLRRDPSHNSLGDGPLYVGSGDFYDDEEDDNGASQQTSHHNGASLDTGNATPNIDQSAANTPQPTNVDTREIKQPLKAEDNESKEGEAGQSTAMDAVVTSTNVKEEEDKDEKPAWLAEFPNSRGWEDLTLQEQIYALWATTEWHLSNADKFRNILVKYRIEPEQPFWRIEPIGHDKDYNVYWMFDDFRLWIERQTPIRRQQLILLEETAERLKARERARQKRIRHEQRMRMKALHERRRQRTAAKKAAEQALDLEIAEMDERDRKKAEEDAANAQANGKATGKRKRVTVPKVDDEADEDFAAEEEEEEENQNTRTSSRLSRTRQGDQAARPSRSTRRRSTRNSSANMQTGGTQGDEEWEKLPPEWLKSEEDERNEDPDFGADQQENGAESGNDSELSMLEEDDDPNATRGTRRSGRASQRPRRSSPRKPRSRSKPAPPPNESDLSDLSDVDAMSLDEAEDGEEEGGDADEKIDLNEPVGYYPDSAWESYKAVPSFDDEDKDQPEGFVRWELLIKELPDWLEFSEKYFPGTEDPKELSLVSWVEEQVIPRVHAELERREEVRKKEEAAKKAAERKARIEREKAAAASGSPAPGPAAHSRTFRSSRIAQKEAKEAEERARAKAEERLKYSATPDRSTSTAAVEAKPESEVDIKIAERDRRAARAREREEAKKAREEAELLAALQESEGGPAEEMKAEAVEMQMDAPQATASMDVNIPICEPGETSAFAFEGGQSSYGTYLAVPSVPSAVTQIPPAPVVSAPGNPAMPSQTALAEPELPVPAPEPEYVVESEDYFLDCSVCKKRGLNLDPNSRLVACDVCDRWEHVVCHRKQDEKEGRPKRDWENDPFLCEDCEGLETSVILPSAPKRERSDKQKAGAKKGAEKRKAKAAAERAKKAAAKAAAEPQPKPVKTTASVPKATQSQASPVAVPVMNGSNSQTHSAAPLPAQQQQQQLHRASHPSHPSPTLQAMQAQQAGAAFQQVSQPSRSPYHPGTPSHSPYAAIPSPSLQPQMQAQGQQYPSAAYQQPGHFQGQPVPQNIQMHHAGQSLPSARYMPQPPPAPQYVGHQQGYPSNGANFQGGFAAQNAYPGASSPQMYSQQGIQNAYRSGGPPMQSSHQPPQSNYQPGYPSYPYNSGPPTPSFAPQQQVQHNVYPGQHQMPQQQGRPSSSDHV